MQETFQVKSGCEFAIHRDEQVSCFIGEKSQTLEFKNFLKSLIFNGCSVRIHEIYETVCISDKESKFIEKMILLTGVFKHE